MEYREHLTIPRSWCHAASFIINAMRDEGLVDVKSANQSLPGRPVETENSLVLGDLLGPLL